MFSHPIQKSLSRLWREGGNVGMSGFCNKGVPCFQRSGLVLKLLGRLGTGLMPGCK